MPAAVTTPPTRTADVLHAVYTRTGRRQRWRLLSLHATRTEAWAVIAALPKGVEAWLTTAPKPPPEADPTFAGCPHRAP